MTGTSLAQIACPTLPCNKGHGRFQTFLRCPDRIRERLLKGLTGFDGVLVRFDRRLQGIDHRFVADGGLPPRNDSRKTFLQCRSELTWRELGPVTRADAGLQKEGTIKGAA